MTRQIRKGRKPGKLPATNPPSMSGKTNVQITVETRDRLLAIGEMSDSYENVIKKVLDYYDEWYEISKPGTND